MGMFLLVFKQPLFSTTNESIQRVRWCNIPSILEYYRCCTYGGWLHWFNFGLKLRCELWPVVPLRVIRRHVVIILILHGGGLVYLRFRIPTPCPRNRVLDGGIRLSRILRRHNLAPSYISREARPSQVLNVMNVI